MKTDLDRASDLLDGIVEWDGRHRLRLRYLKAGGLEELHARRALAALLRSDEGLSRQLRVSLAELFDPKPPDWRQQRKLVFQLRRVGKPTDHYANTQIFLEVHDQVKAGSKPAKAIIVIAEKHSISEDLVKRIWSEYRGKYDLRLAP
jgi:hypothetical protein